MLGKRVPEFKYLPSRAQKLQRRLKAQSGVHGALSQCAKTHG